MARFYGSIQGARGEATRLGHTNEGGETMSRNDPTEILVAVHRDQPDTNAVLVSINGEGKRAHWVARSQIFSYHLIGTSTEGTDQNGVRKRLPLANMTVPEWLAKDRGFI